MKKTIGLFIAFFAVVSLQAQSVEVIPGASYKQALGIKFPGGFSVSYKKFVTANNNLEAQLTFANGGTRVSGLYEFNFYSFPSVQNLSWFVGPGAHAGVWTDKQTTEQGTITRKTKADVGVDGIIGLDYKFADIPINVSIDWQPSVTLVGNAGFTPAIGGLAVRYTF